MKFVGVREFKEGVIRFLNDKEGVVVLRYNRPIARLTPVEEGSAEDILLGIGSILDEAGVTKKQALAILEGVRREMHVKDRH
ncbi:MAG: hypothetical protein PHU25_14315 [Deltaproteobacteria bacterium]|nr:hypothetical protein [Deltaproteobacteria bacterium]